ncbi:DUF4350 domain-containing protein [Metabacillus malikii]|uniref:DUF4350 domain-containing protein n=1 Tax=Metabacillus malikii TaxID=1504265 RepID=A0ABT9ZFT4_9BACI|nr:DUF4350 domain-containing protein [Metabacillus malikii]MDQ0231145.1 hypothetical protein [Metabacillus malikii]
MQKLLRNKWTLLSVLILIVLASSYYVGTGQKKSYPNYVSHSPAPSGVKAFYTYLDHHLGAVNRWSHVPNLLDKDKQQLLIMIEPTITPDSEEVEQYTRFMEAGNTILLMMANPKDLFDTNIIFTDDEQSSLIVSDMNNRVYESEMLNNVYLVPEETDEVLLQSGDGQTMALKRPYGDGELIIANNPNWMTNEHILKADHLPLVLQLLNEVEDIKTVYFNEYVHGDQETSIMKVYPKWFLLLVIQGGIIVIFFLWYRGKRFGYIMVPREETVRFSDERIKALAAWYLKSEQYRDALAIQADYLKLLLQERWGIPYKTSWLDSEGKMSNRSRHSHKYIQNFVGRLTILLREKRISKKDYLEWSKQIDELRKEVEEG